MVGHASRILGTLTLTVLLGCSGSPAGTNSEAALSETDMAASGEVLLTESAERDSSAVPSIANAQPSTQLIKRATLTLEIDDVESTLETISGILAQHQGELLQLSDTDARADDPRTVDLQLRVPQANLNVVLKSLKALGQVEHQSVVAEDVSTQLVDLQARVRNLRKSEESLLGIMERSGSIPDVLEVSRRELSTVREAIERHEAQLKKLQTQVTYSTIALTLMESGAIATEASPIRDTLGQTWQAASSSMQSLSIGLLQIALWGLAFSPYIGILLLCSWLSFRYMKRPSDSPPPAESN
ncbi:MAG: DUF4349 domain-containing protein [Leptolyngbyaceae cyanobacterium]